MTDKRNLSRPSVEAKGDKVVAIGGDVVQSTIATGDVNIHWTAGTAPDQPLFKRYLRMLAIVAAPVVGSRMDDPSPAPLDLWAEWRRLEEAIRKARDEVQGQGVPWAVVRLNPPTRHQLADALTAGDPTSAYQVVHFSGHGAPSGLTMEDELGRTDFVTNTELVDLFRDKPVRLAFLNACRTEALARRLRTEARIPAVIATTDSLRDDEAQVLTSRVYAQLARGRSVAEAFAEARTTLRYLYERGDLLVPPHLRTDSQAYIVERLAVPVLLGDAQLTLPPEDERAQRPLITLAEPPSRGLEMHLIEGFVGRGPELVQIARWLRQRPSPVIALSGLGGIGKSALAATATLRGSHRFRAIVCLSARGEPHLKPSALVPPLDSVLDKRGDLASTPTEAERLEQAIAALNQTPTLLVLDNLEDLTESATCAWTNFLGRLDPRRGSVAILTLRPAVKHPLTDLAGIAHLALERLGKPDALRLLANGLTSRGLWHKVPAAIDLPQARQEQLENLAKQAHLSWLPPVRLIELDKLATRAGCHPYTLRLALGDLSYDHVDWDKVLENVSDLRGRDWEAEAKKMVGRMVGDLVEVAPEAVNLLQSMLVFQGGATYAALYAVAAPEVDEITFDDRLRAALDASLLDARGGETTRYDLHPLTRSYLEQYHSSSKISMSSLHRRHARYFVEWTRRLDDESDQVIRELANIKLTCNQLESMEEASDEDLIEVVSNTEPALKGSSYWDDRAFLLEKAQGAAERLGDRERQAVFIASLAQMLTNQSDYQAALNWAKEAINLASQTGDESTLAEAYLRVGWTCLYLGRFGEALEYLEQAERLAEGTGQLGTLASALHFTFRVYTEMGDFKRALEYFQARMRLPRKAKEPGAWAFTWLRGAEIFLAMGKTDVARRFTLKAKVMFEANSVASPSSYVLRTLGQVNLREGNAQEAVNLLSQALREMKYRRGEVNVRQDLAEAHIGLGNFDEATRLIDTVIRLRRAAGERKWLADALYLKGRIEESIGNLEQALSLYEESLDLFEEAGCLPVVSEDCRSAIDRIRTCL